MIPRAIWDLRASPGVNPFLSPIPEKVLFLFLYNRALSAEAMRTGRGRIHAGSRPLSLSSAGTIHLFATCLMKALHSLSLIYDE